MENKLTEISRAESALINGGGIIPPVIAGLIIAGMAEIIRDWDNFKNGLAGRRETKLQA